MSDHIPRKDVTFPPTISEAKLMARIEELESKLAKAIWALHNIADSYEATSELHMSAADCAANLYDYARTALASLQGDKI